nr:MAG TPA: hypothetical protein [Caudoviricetes sp.]DAI53071.1 MAG TPA: hypothetical protein [Caudoviricetes sp.]
MPRCKLRGGVYDYCYCCGVYYRSFDRCDYLFRFRLENGTGENRTRNCARCSAERSG